jgi:hypothetical protein
MHDLFGFAQRIHSQPKGAIARQWHVFAHSGETIAERVAGEKKNHCGLHMQELDGCSEEVCESELVMRVISRREPRIRCLGC